MEIEIQVISNEIIKPSSPTPESQSKYNLSFLDQMAPPIYMPIIYFYPSDDDDDKNDSILERLNILKKSLSQALSIYYPLSGRVFNNSYVDCSDQGAQFVEAEANCDLSRVITIPNPENMDKFLPYRVDEAVNLGMAVQVTHFQCGGIAIGLVVSHKIADALSFFRFANAWAEIAKHGPEHNMITRPIFETASIFPPCDLSGFKPRTGMQKKELLETKIFTFPSSKISILKDRYSGAENNHRPTRVEALSAFIWTRFVSSMETKPDPSKIYAVLHAINLRTRLDPPLSEHHFGNISRLAIAIAEARDDGQRLDDGYELLEKVRKAIKEVDADYVSKLKTGDHLSIMKEMMAQAIKGELVSLNFTSLCRFPLYEVDFGWGKPVWVGSAGLIYKNLVTFIDTADGDGIEAWINLRKEDMEKFEVDLELQEFTTSAIAQDNY